MTDRKEKKVIICDSKEAQGGEQVSGGPLEMYRDEATTLLRLGVNNHDIELTRYAKDVIRALAADDGSPGLSEFLKRSFVLPNLNKARARASYYTQQFHAHGGLR